MNWFGWLRQVTRKLYQECGGDCSESRSIPKARAAILAELLDHPGVSRLTVRLRRQADHDPRRGRTRINVLVLLAVMATVVAGGCTTAKDLAPAFQANRANIADLATNLTSINQRLRPLAEAAWDHEIEYRRSRVLLELQALATSYEGKLDMLTGAQLDRDLSDPAKSWKADYDQLGPALSAAAGNPAELDRLQALHPVLSARATLTITADQIAGHARRLRQSRGSVPSVRSELTRDYPYVGRAVAAKEDSLKKLDDLSAALDKQIKLASAHAQLFEFAASSDVNAQAALVGVVSDKDLQGQVLGLIKDDKWKASATDAFAVLTGLLNKQTADEAAKQK